MGRPFASSLDLSLLCSPRQTRVIPPLAGWRWRAAIRGCRQSLTPPKASSPSTRVRSALTGGGKAMWEPLGEGWADTQCGARVRGFMGRLIAPLECVVWQVDRVRPYGRLLVASNADGCPLPAKDRPMNRAGGRPALECPANSNGPDGSQPNHPDRVVSQSSRASL